MKTATDMGIAVYTIGGPCTEEVADTTMCHILNLYRRVSHLNEAVKSGKNVFDINLYEYPKILVHILGKKPQNAEQVRDVADGCMRIRGDKLGIVGLGNIGTAVALRAKAFGFEVLYYDPEIPDGKGRSLGLKKMNTLNELLHDSDCVSVHCALTRQTYNLFNEVSFSKMRQVSYEFKSLLILTFVLGRIFC